MPQRRRGPLPGLQELGCLSEGLGANAVPGDSLAGLAAAAVAGIALGEAAVQGATSAALAADLAVPVQGPGLLQEGLQQSVIAT